MASRYTRRLESERAREDEDRVLMAGANRLQGEARRESVGVAAFALLLLLSVLGSGCAHKTLIQTEPPGANIFIDDRPLGPSPVVYESGPFSPDSVRVRVEAEGYEVRHGKLGHTEWFLWPALLAGIPVLGVPIGLPFVLIPLIGPIIAVAIAVVWGVATSPALLSLLFLRQPPEELRLVLKPRVAGGIVLPSDAWLVPDEYSPNPLPPPPEPTPTDDVPQPKQPDGGNVIP
jgi:hypothetical protein